MFKLLKKTSQKNEEELFDFSLLKALFRLNLKQNNNLFKNLNYKELNKLSI